MVKEITFGAGCFWCIEAVFNDLNGVLSVIPGYAGGIVENPSYEEVCSGMTKHIEVARIQYDDALVSFDELLKVFWFVHDPTQIGGQGADIGDHYSSVIFYHEEPQGMMAEKYKNQMDAEGIWEKPIVTLIKPVFNFYPAEENHVDYFKLNPRNPYCQAVVRPKIERFRKVFSDKLKD